MNFPGHNYLGPGNPVVNGEPVDEDDRIAQRHDIAYDEATSDEHIRAADRSAIGHFAQDYFTTGNYHSAIGAIGLGIKYAGESVFGVQYPRNVNKRTAVKMSGSRTDPGGPEAKRSKRDGEEAGAMDISESAKKQSAEKSIHSNANSEGHGINIHHPISDFKTGKLVYVHQRIMYSKGYQFKCLDTLLKPDSVNTMSVMTTPFARVPCDFIPWYLKQNEFDNLPHNSSIKRCRTVITPLGFRTPFITNSSGLNSVNSNLFVMGMHAHGLINTYHGADLQYTITADKPCVPTSVDWPPGYQSKSWWGTNLANTEKPANPSFEEIPCCVGNQHPFRTYYCVNYIKRQDCTVFPELMKSIHIFNLENSMNNPSVEWSYNPQVSIIHPQLPSIPFVNNKAVMNYGCKPISYRQFTVVPNTTIVNVNNVNVSTEVATSLGTVGTGYESYIEMSGSIGHGISEFGGGMMPPSLHVGVLPVHSYSTSPTDDDIQDVTVIYKVDTECEITYSYDYIYSYGTTGNAHSACMGDLDFVTATTQTVNAYGYKCSVSDKIK